MGKTESMSFCASADALGMSPHSLRIAAINAEIQLRKILRTEEPAETTFEDGPHEDGSHWGTVSITP